MEKPSAITENIVMTMVMVKMMKMTAVTKTVVGIIAEIETFVF